MPKPLEKLSQALSEDNPSKESLDEKDVVVYRRFSSKWSDELEAELQKDDNSSKAALGSFQVEDSNLIYLLQHGIKKSLLAMPDLDRDLLMTDFREVSIMNFSKSGPNYADGTFVLCTYAASAFRYFRELFGISTEDFVQSICDEPLSQFPTSSSSGSRLYTSSDSRFLMKTCHKNEADFLIDLFPGYFLNITQHPKTLLPKFFGLFRYRRGVQTMYVMITNNLFPTFINIQEVFDLKGATYIKRRALNIKVNDIKTPQHIMKDLDFLDRWPHGLYLQKKIYNLLIKSVERDCTVLESYGIMDYSLLIGIHKLEKHENIGEQPSTSGEKSKSVSSEPSFQSPNESNQWKIKNVIGPFQACTWRGNKVHVFLGIIDILQDYTFKKKLEHLFKSLKYSSSSISVTNSDFYSKRFQQFLKDSVFKCIPVLPSTRGKERLCS